MKTEEAIYANDLLEEFDASGDINVGLYRKVFEKNETTSDSWNMVHLYSGETQKMALLRLKIIVNLLSRYGDRNIEELVATRQVLSSLLLGIDDILENALGFEQDKAFDVMKKMIVKNVEKYEKIKK